MIGAKKLTLNTWLQVSVSIEPSRLPPSAFGEIAALLTSACSAPLSSRSRISAIARVVSAWSARSTWIWSSGPASHGQSSGKGCREQVMTRQPALEKRITVAWPMPRLAPVRSSVRRGVLAEFGINGSLVLRHARPCAGHQRLPLAAEENTWLWIKPDLRPWLARRRAAEFDAVVQAKRPVVPEFELCGHDPPAAPPLRARYFADNVLGRDLGDRLLEGKPAFQRLRLLAGPGSDLRLFRSGREIGVGLRFRHRRHVAADTDLAAQRLPVKQQRGLGICGQLAALLAGDVAVEHETVGVVALHQHHADVGKALRIDGGERHGVGVAGLGLHGFREPVAKQRKRLLGIGEITGC